MKKIKFVSTIALVAAVMVCLSLSGCKKEDLGATSGTIGYGNDVFTVSIGETGTDDQDNIWVELTGNLPGGFIISMGKLIPYLGMRIIVDGKTLEYDSMTISSRSYYYFFKTKKNPSRIIVYSNDGSNATLNFDGKRKTVIK